MEDTTNDAPAENLQAEPAEAQPTIHITDTNLATLLDLAPMVGRYLVAIVTLSGPLLVLLKNLDLQGLITYTHGADWKTLGSAVIGLGTIGYGLWRAWVKRRKLVVTATAAPNTVAVVKTA